MSRICRNMGILCKPRFHELEHKSKMRLLKIHTHTCERRGYEAEKERQVKVKEKRPIRTGQKKRQGKPPPYHWRGGRVENVSTGKRNTEVAPQPQRGGARRHYTTEKEKKKHTQSCATVAAVKAPRTPLAPRVGGSARRKGNEYEKPAVQCHNLAARLPRPWPGTERWGVGGRPDGKKTQRPPQAQLKKTQKACFVP